MKTVDIDVHSWCDPDIDRYKLDTPFVKDGFIYATDGRRCIRLPATGEPDSYGPEIKTPDPRPIFAPFSKAEFSKLERGEPHYFDEDGYHSWCPDCRQVKCEICEGAGEKFCEHCRCVNECHVCEGDGTVSGNKKCKTCSGGITKGPFKCCETILGMKFNLLLTNEVWNLPNVQFAKDDHSTQLWVRFDGGEACVMAMEGPQH